ncbi:hypothetical protein FRC03_010042 [Tulasnella sp. 419]|nr:hypothetical protein FRC03_010042 [Tulasnella sp. 419]
MAAHVMPLANERPRLQNLEIRPRTSSLRILRSPDRLRSGCQYTIGLKLLQSQFRKLSNPCRHPYEVSYQDRTPMSSISRSKDAKWRTRVIARVDDATNVIQVDQPIRGST